jgi:serine phosphatase RsbU (regulator of sigma subunit)
VVSRGGSRILLAGDVSGKGLDAAMLVAVIIGALRREPSREPGTILANLNCVLLSGKRQGFVTCCCLRIEPDGAMTVCNAGHVAPYIDGRELSLPNALPLGIVETSYEETRVALTPGCQITIVSDGVIQAATAKGELFGFERTAAISLKPANAIAEAARAWGQNDDITVVTVQRTAACA